MQDAMNYANWAVDFFKAGFAQVNLILAVVIALYWSWRIADWGALLTSAIGAVLMHIVAIVLAPVVDHNGPLHLPPYQDAGFWRFVAALFLGYTVVIGVLYLLKSMIMNRSSGEDEAVGSMLMAGAAGAAAVVSHGTGDHGGGHDDHGHGGGHDDHGHGGGHDDHGHGGGHDDHGHGGGHDDHGHGGGHDDHGHGGRDDHHGHH